MAMSYHMEARIKQDRLNRWHELKRQAEMEPSQGMGNKLEFSSNKQKKESVLVTDPGQFHQIRPPPLPMFRVNQEGYCNRYQNRQHLNPHVEEAFATIYPGSDNSDYSSDVNRVYRRMNIALDKYHVSKTVNGEFHMQLSKASEATELSVHAWTGTEHNRRSYDYSCEGPLLGSSWRDLRRELNFREKSLPTAMFEGRGRVVPRHEFVPADPAFMSK